MRTITRFRILLFLVICIFINTDRPLAQDTTSCLINDSTYFIDFLNLNGKFKVSIIVNGNPVYKGRLYSSISNKPRIVLDMIPKEIKLKIKGTEYIIVPEDERNHLVVFQTSDKTMQIAHSRNYVQIKGVYSSSLLSKKARKG